MAFLVRCPFNLCRAPRRVDPVMVHLEIGDDFAMVHTWATCPRCGWTYIAAREVGELQAAAYAPEPRYSTTVRDVAIDSIESTIIPHREVIDWDTGIGYVADDRPRKPSEFGGWVIEEMTLDAGWMDGATYGSAP